MKLNGCSRSEIERRLFSLMDVVSIEVQKNPNIDKFLDSTEIFDEWDFLFSDLEYPIFLIAVLNNIRRKSIVDIIVAAVMGTSSHSKEPLQEAETNEDHPFC